MSNLPPPQSRESLGTTFKRLVRRVIWPSNARSGETRIEAGADTPPELQAYGIIVALLFYITDVATGLEVGYFFIGQSNTMDVGNQKDLLFGNVKYPTPGVPSSAGMADVKTNHQIELFDTSNPGDGYTIFKDSIIRVNSTVPALELFCTDVFFQTSGQVQFNGPQTFFDLLTVFNPGSSTVWNNTADFERQNGGNVSVAGDVGKGLVNFAYSNTASGLTVAGAPFSAEIVVMTITSHVFESGRAYRIVLLGGFNSGTAGTSGNFFLRKGITVAGVMWWDYYWSVAMLAGGAVGGIPGSHGYLRRTAGSNLTSSISLTMRSNNAATGQHYADATHPRGFVIYDCGEAADFPFAFDVV